MEKVYKVPHPGGSMNRFQIAVMLFVCLSSFALRAAESPVAEPPEKKLDPAHLKALTEAIGAKPGETKGQVHTLTLPREDLDVVNLDMGEIPTEAGLATTLHVFRCGCGKYYVIGDFCVTDYESNDVIDALRGGQFQIASVSPVLLQEKPRILSIRFQGEGEIEHVTKTLKEAFRWIGENRTKRNPIKE
jgi:hypothetical protein